MQFLAHSGGYNSGETANFSYFMRDNGLKLLFVSFVFIAFTYAITIYISKQSVLSKKSNKEESHDK